MEEDKAITNQIINTDMQLGEILAQSKVFPDIQTAAQGYIKVLAGKELGFSPIQSLGLFYFVEGKIGMMSQGVAALIKRSEKYDYGIAVHNSKECTIIFYAKKEEGKEEIGKSQYTFEMAAKAGIVNKHNWKAYPMNMLFARALMNGVRWFCPDILSTGLYAVEELQDLTEEKPTIVKISDDDIKQLKQDDKKEETI